MDAKIASPIMNNNLIFIKGDEKMLKRLTDRTYRSAIAVDEVTNFMVQRFADKYCVEGSIINVASYLGLTVVAFNTYRDHDFIFEKLQKEFGENFNVKKEGNIIVSVTKKES